MQRLTKAAMDALGGSSEIARLIKAPISTVHSWKTKGITEARLDHLRLAAKEAGIAIDWSTALEDAPDETNGEPTKAAA